MRKLFTRWKGTTTEGDRSSRMLTVSAGAMSLIFLVLGAAVWVSQKSLISTSNLVTISRESVTALDAALSDLVEADSSDRGCREKDEQACARALGDRRDFMFLMRSLGQFPGQDRIETARLQLINENLQQAIPSNQTPPDAEALATITSSAKSLRNYEQLELNQRLNQFERLGVNVQRTMLALLTVGAILLLAGQGVLWSGIRKQRRVQRQLEGLNANLNLARREALALSEAKGRFLADMSHEIRTPLNGIVGMASMLSLGRLAPEDAEILRTIRASSDVLLRVVDDVLDLSKIDSNRVELLSQPLELNTLLRDVSSLYRGMADHNRNQLILDIPDAENWVLGDAVRLKQTFGNLVSNAVKFCREGEVRVSISGSADGVHRVAVSDTGVGIAPDRLENIFDEFIQAQISVSQEHPGTGLGLAIARKLVRRMGGEILVKSVLGVGSEFEVVLPLTACPAPTTSDSASKPNVEGLRILLAEDNNVNILVATSILQRAGCFVEVAHDGVEATEMAIAGSYDVVLMDLRMPLRQGIEATTLILRAFQGRATAPKIVAMTANASPEDREACTAAGMVAFLPKPFTYEMVIETLSLIGPARV